MALITTAPETISGKITAIFKSVAQLSEDAERINLVINFTDSNGKPIYGVKAVYTDEDDQIGRISDRIAVGQAISRMPELWRKIVLLRYYRNMTQQETADCLGLSQVKVSREEKKIMSFLRNELVG